MWTQLPKSEIWDFSHRLPPDKKYDEKMSKMPVVINMAKALGDHSPTRRLQMESNSMGALFICQPSHTLAIL